MKQYKDIINTVVHCIILVLFLVVAYFLHNELVKGILLLLFSGALIGNTIFKLIAKKDGKLGSKVFYSFVLFFECLLAVGAISVIIMAVL